MAVYRAKASTEAKRFAETAHGKNRGQVWTGADMEIAMRDDLSLEEIALMLGRTYKAVRMMRFRARNEPKYRRVLGSP